MTTAVSPASINAPLALIDVTVVEPFLDLTDRHYLKMQFQFLALAVLSLSLSALATPAPVANPAADDCVCCSQRHLFIHVLTLFCVVDHSLLP